MTRRPLILPAQRTQLTANGLRRLGYPARLQLVPVVRLIVPGYGRHWYLSETHPGSRDVFWGLDVDGMRVEFGPVSLEMLGRIYSGRVEPDDLFIPREPIAYWLVRSSSA